MDKRSEIITSQTRKKSEDRRQRELRRDRSPHRRDGRRNSSQNISLQSGDIQHTEETQRLFHDDTNQSRGRSRSPGRQEKKKSGDRRTSPHRRHSVHDSSDQDDSRIRTRGHSPDSRRRGKKQSPDRGRKQGVRFQSPVQTSSNQRNSFQETQIRSAGGNQSPHRSRKGDSKQNQSPNLHVSNHKSRRQSPQRANSRSRRNRKPHVMQLKTLDRHILDAETATFRLAIMSIILHIVAIGSSLMVIIPLALISGRWQSVRRTCPIYVHNNIGYDVDWGNPSMATCNIVAFLPIVILVLSFFLILFHYGILHTWYTNDAIPVFALTRKYSVGTMLLTLVEAMVAWTVACMLTDGFRQTCLSFELTPAPEDRPISCRYGFDDRDETYMFKDLDTFKKLMIGLSGSWLCVMTTTVMAVSALVRVCTCRST